jgi:hypothetical protein
MNTENATAPGLAPVAKTINLRDEASLTWFFGPGQSAFERSTFAGILRRIDSSGFTSTRCSACDGAGIMEDGGFWLKELRNDVTLEKVVIEERAVHGGWCDRCRGTGSTPLRRKASREEITVRPKPESPEGAGHAPADFLLTRYATVSRRLTLVARQDTVLFEALAGFYGDMGARWGRTRYTRLFAIYALTTAGHKLVRMSMSKTNEGLTLSAAERIGVEADLEAQQPKPNRRALLDAASNQAAELYRRAAMAWNTTAPIKRDAAPESDVEAVA